jgi:hypothetical protein
MKDVTVKNLIVNYPYVYKTFFERAASKTRKEKKDLTTINMMRTSVNAIIAFLRENPITFRTSPKITITLNDLVELRGLINLDAEINYIDKTIYKQLLKMVIILNPNIEMVSHSNYRISFIRIYENIRLAVRPIKYEVCLFIIDVKTSHFLMLGTSFIF